ncbi:uncharacterized protein LOC107865177 [Capsicum annuum]|uniref:uncharacterized protein LOC107865177 n=1 Tax=Capsicum annuum TaxID=4072 RepID=UPI001FB0611C|nr:uncharacterized protein LOC107865177 [Capsicum annuum]
MGHDINKYKLVPENIKASATAKETKDVQFERNIKVFKEDLLLEKKLNTEQRRAYTLIIDRIFSNKVGVFFIDGLGGTGKSYLYRSLLGTIRSKGFVALATASFSVVASILSGGRTVKIPVDIDENTNCNVSKQSSLASLIRDAKLVVWGEASMAKGKIIEALDLLLKDLMDTKMLFGEKVVVLGGDFRETLHVVRNEKKEDFISQTLLYSQIWNQLEKLHLSENMRARTDPSFSEYLMRIGNEKEKFNSNDKVENSKYLLIPFTTEE